MKEHFSVLMSLYIKEKPEYFRQCMESMLRQTVLPDEIVIVKDGPLTVELENTLAEYVAADPELYTIVPLEKNVGLGLALAEGLLHCRNELVARMDTDDIAAKDRFEKQLRAFADHPEIDICGGQITEFEGRVDNIVAKRTVPTDHTSIVQYQKRRDAFNHVTVMFKKSAVLRAGNYQSALLMEDTLLWANMIMTGAKCMNLEDTLVFVRVGADMFERRGGWKYFLKYKEGRKKVYETGFISRWDYFYTLTVQLAVALMPQKLRGFVFKKMLHR